MNKDVKEYIRGLKDRGWYQESTIGSGHIKMIYKPGGYVILPATPSDRRWVYNSRADVKRIEKEFGPYIKLKLERSYNGKFGLNYTKEEPMNLAAPEDFTIPEEPPIVTPILKPSGITMAQIPNKDLIVSVLTRRKEELIEKLQPQRELLTELDQIMETLKTLTGDASLIWKGQDIVSVRMRQEKIEKFLETKKPAPPIRLRVEDVYQKIKEVVQANNNEMGIEELTTWMHEMHGLEKSATQSLNTKIVSYINLYNKANPGKVVLELYHLKRPGDKRAPHCELVRHKSYE